MKKRRVGNIKVVVNVVIKSKGKKVMNKRLKSCKGYDKVGKLCPYGERT